MTGFPNAQNLTGGAIPVYITSGGGGGGGGGGGLGPPAGTPNGFQQGVTTGVFTPTIPANTTALYVSIEGSTARWRDDGIAPTATVGMPIYMGGPLTFAEKVLTGLSFVSSDGSSITYNISYYK